MDAYRRVDRTAAAPRGMAALVRGLGVMLLARARFKAACLAEQRRLHHARRHPASLITRLAAAKSILVVCHGNIIRSPFAAALLAQAPDAPKTIGIASAGLAAMAARPAHPIAVRAAAVHGVDLSAHAAGRVTAEAVAGADVIFVMDAAQSADLQRRFAGARPKTFLLTSLAPDAPLEIRDPVDRDEPVFQRCFDDIRRAVRPIARVLSAGGHAA